MQSYLIIIIIVIIVIIVSTVQYSTAMCYVEILPPASPSPTSRQWPPGAPFVKTLHGVSHTGKWKCAYTVNPTVCHTSPHL